MGTVAAAISLAVSGCGLAGRAALPAGAGEVGVTNDAVSEGSVEVGDGVRLHYRRAGRGGETVVVLHGGPGLSMDYLADELQPLARRHTVVFYDQRGAGRSSLVAAGAELDAQRFVDDLEALRVRFGLARLTLLGHSWGAGLAALYAARYPQHIERLLLVGAMPLRRPELDRSFQRIRASRSDDERARLRQAATGWLADPSSADACRAFMELWFVPFYGPATRRSKGDFCAGGPAALKNRLEAVERITMPSLGDFDWRAPLRTLKAPVLVVHGSADAIPVESAREWAAALPNARLLVLEGIGHFPYVEAPQPFFAAAEVFLQGRWPAGAVAVADAR